MNSEIFWLIFWPVFIYISYLLIRISIKKYEKEDKKELH